MLDSDEILDSTAAQEGLTKFVDADMRRRFSDLIACFNQNGDIPAPRLPQALDDFRTLVKHRLMIERDFALYPEIADEEIAQPIFVIGNPRTGTTILQCLLAEDEQNQMLRYWHSHFPSPPPGHAPDTVAGRIEQTSALVEQLVALMPGMLPCHPYLDQGGMAELEDEDLFALDFQSTFPFHFSHVPVLPIGSVPREPVAAFRFHKRMLQYFQWKNPKKRWVCKGTSHQFLLSALWEVYPDALCIWPHRDQAEFLASTVEMIDVLYGPITGVDQKPHALAFIDSIRAGYDHLLGTPQIHDPRVAHIPFPLLMKDKVNAIRTIYEKFNLDFTPEFERAIPRWLDDPAHRTDRHGRFHYAIEKFGLTREEIATRFADYHKTFGLSA